MKNVLKLIGGLLAVRRVEVLRSTTAPSAIAELQSHDGFAREAAAKLLINRPEKGALPFLLERLNDWVPQVRAAAKEAVRAMMRTEFLPDWIASLGGLVILKRAQRADHAATLTTIYAFLSRPENLPSVVEAVRTETPRVQRLVFDLEWNADPLDSARFQLLTDVLTRSDVVLASKAVQRARELSSSDWQRRFYEIASASRFAGVRHGGVRWLVENSDDSTASVIHTVGFDSNSHVRWWCLHWMRANGGVDTAAAQAENVASCEAMLLRQRRSAMQFLVDADFHRALLASESWLTSTAPRLRFDALSLRLAKANYDEKVRLLKVAYGDPSPTVNKLALANAGRGGWLPSRHDLLDMLRKETTPEGWRRILGFLSLYAQWNRLDCLFEIWPFGVELGLSEVLEESLQRWHTDSRLELYGPDTALSKRLIERWAFFRLAIDSSLRQAVDKKFNGFGMGLGEKKDSHVDH